jgi:hypothetical protein
VSAVGRGVAQGLIKQRIMIKVREHGSGMYVRDAMPGGKIDDGDD